MEEWRKIEDVPVYEVSNLGRVRRVADGRGVKNLGKPMRTSVINSGYLVACLTMNGKRYRRLVHILVARAFVVNPSPATLDQVNHVDLNKLNPVASNLEWSNGHLQQLHAMRCGAIVRKGVRFHADRNKWQAYIKIGGKFKHLGRFSTESEARAVRLEAERLYWPELHAIAHTI